MTEKLVKTESLVLKTFKLHHEKICQKQRDIPDSTYVQTDQHPLRKRLHIRSVISVNYHYITVLCSFNLLIRFKCYNAA